MERKMFNPLILLPTTGVWVLGGIGFATGDDLLIGLAVALLITTAAVLLVRKLKISAVEKKERQRIWSNGIEAVARVISIGTRGGGINDHPMIDFELEVQVPGRDPYRVETRALISRLAIPRIQPDCEIAVRVDPNVPSKLLVDAKLTPYGY